MYVKRQSISTKPDIKIQDLTTGCHELQLRLGLIATESIRIPFQGTSDLELYRSGTLSRKFKVNGILVTDHKAIWSWKTKELQYFVRENY